jgi:hypothetical protein
VIAHFSFSQILTEKLLCHQDSFIFSLSLSGQINVADFFSFIENHDAIQESQQEIGCKSMEIGKNRTNVCAEIGSGLEKRAALAIPLR